MSFKKLDLNQKTSNTTKLKIHIMTWTCLEIRKASSPEMTFNQLLLKCVDRISFFYR